LSGTTKRSNGGEVHLNLELKLAALIRRNS
jgi:hypothetical protein